LVLYDPGVADAAECVFCRIVAGKERAWLVYENEHAVAILDRSPSVPGHTLVLPRRHAADIWDIRREDAGRLMEAVHDVAALLEERLSPDGMTQPLAVSKGHLAELDRSRRRHGFNVRVSWASADRDAEIAGHTGNVRVRATKSPLLSRFTVRKFGEFQ